MIPRGRLPRAEGLSRFRSVCTRGCCSGWRSQLWMTADTPPGAGRLPAPPHLPPPPRCPLTPRRALPPQTHTLGPRPGPPAAPAPGLSEPSCQPRGAKPPAARAGAERSHRRATRRPRAKGTRGKPEHPFVLTVVSTISGSRVLFSCDCRSFSLRRVRSFFK